MAKLFKIRSNGLRWIVTLIALCLAMGVVSAVFAATGFGLKLIGWKRWQETFHIAENMGGLIISGFFLWSSVYVAVVIYFGVRAIGNYCFNHASDKKVEDKKKEGIGG